MVLQVPVHGLRSLGTLAAQPAVEVRYTLDVVAGRTDEEYPFPVSLDDVHASSFIGGQSDWCDRHH